MQIILLERIESLGHIGEEVTVRDGYARNFLLPQKKALRATDANRARFESQRKEIEARNLKRRQEAEAVAKTMDNVNCSIIRQAGETGQLYGSVSGRDIAEALSAAGYHVERGQVVLNKPIKALGAHQVKVSLHPDVAVMVTVNVARTEAEAADLQAAAFFESEEAAKALAEGEAAAEDAEQAAEA